MTRAGLIEFALRRRLTVLLALGALSGCTMDAKGVQTPAVSLAGGSGGVSPAGGATASGGTSSLGGDSGASGNTGVPAREAGVGPEDAPRSGGSSGSDTGAGSGGASASGGSSGSGTGAGSGGASASGGSSGSDTGTGSGGASANGGSSGSDTRAGSGGASANGGSSGSNAGAGSGGPSANGGSSRTDAAAGSGGTSASAGASGGDAGSGSTDAAGSDAVSGHDAAIDSGTGTNWHLVWSDEFNLDANTGANTTNWNVATWEPNTVNGEQQKYTTRLQNVFHDGQGHIVLRGLHDYWNSNGTIYPYTSGRLQTDGKFQFTFGRVEVRAKLPAGKGSFPAILLMGTTGNWPQCGEIGMMEQWGQDKTWLYCSTYAGGASGDIGNQKVTFPSATTLSSDFHVYALEWYSDHMVFFIDDAQVARSNFDTTSPFYTGTYYLLLDVAIGGTMGGAIDNAGGFPMDMVLDYVRVYAQ